MLKLPVYLYPNSYDLILDLDDNQRIHRTMYQRDLIIQKGIKNKIQLQFKNSDQKPVNINGKSFVFSMFNSNDQRLMVQKTVDILDDGATTSTRGLALLTLTESDTWGLDSTSYQFGVKMADDDGTYVPTYANTYYTMAGTLKLVHELLPALQPGLTITQFQRNLNRDPGVGQYIWDSGNMPANPAFHGNGEYHSFAYYLTNYTGWIYTQGSLDNNPPASGNPSTFANIESRYYSHYTGIDYVNFQGAWTYTRLTYIPDAPAAYPGRNDMTQYTGTLDKLLYRC